MDIVEGAAAFAVVMIVMSTIVTGIAEAALRLLSVRQAVLVEVIERLVVDRIAPRARRAAQNGDQQGRRIWLHRRGACEDPPGAHAQPARR